MKNENINLKEEELLEQNPWRDVAQQYGIDNNFLFAPDDKKYRYVCENDLKTIEDFNNQVKDENCKYQLNCPAYPWLGNPLKAKVILLSLNPGYDNNEQTFGKSILSNLPENIVNEYAQYLRKTLILKSEGMLPPKGITRDLANFHGSFYWYNRIDKAFINPEDMKRKPDIDFEQVNKNLAVIQLVGYSSCRFHPFYKGQNLNSQDFTRKLITYILHNRDTIFVILRSVDMWAALLGDEFTKNINRFIIRVNRNQSISVNALKEDYGNVVRLLRDKQEKTR